MLKSLCQVDFKQSSIVFTVMLINRRHFASTNMKYLHLIMFLSVENAVTIT